MLKVEVVDAFWLTRRDSAHFLPLTITVRLTLTEERTGGRNTQPHLSRTRALNTGRPKVQCIYVATMLSLPKDQFSPDPGSNN